MSATVTETKSSDANSNALNENGLDPTAGYDEEQVRLMEEVCILVDEDDKPYGSASKKECHLNVNIFKPRELLHRAFSVFLFDPDTRKLLLQQRALEKITFPMQWTNTCCSHPLATVSENGASLKEAVEGVKRAARRKLEHELGISPEQVPLDKFEFITRIHYRAESDSTWGEHEIDYILIILAKVDIVPNENEVNDFKYVSADELRLIFADKTLSYTPWFSLICEKFLFHWWNNLDNIEKIRDVNTIHRLL